MLPYIATIFLSALLVFSVQPLLGKALLPWFGGGPSVWSACLLFFQVALLLGYLWAHVLDRILAPRKQAVIHLLALMASLVVMIVLWFTWPAPLIPSSQWKPHGTAFPALHILLILTVSAGLPYVLLSSTSSLLQTWVRDRSPDKPMWRLYALSNVGSLIGLLAYPFAAEPLMGLVLQGRVWAGLYTAYVLGMVLCAIPRLRTNTSPSAADKNTEPDQVPVERSSAYRRWMWFGLSATGSMLLLAGTNQMCQEVAVIPFLWVLPLAAYLLSFIIAFHSDRAYGRLWAGFLFVTSVGASVAALYLEYKLRIPWQVLIYSSLVFSGSLLCHGELVRLKPSPSGLTGFYLTIAAGGATGGAFVALLAPLIFKGYWELHVAVALSASLHVVVLLADPESWICTSGKKLKTALVSIALIALIGALVYQPILFSKNVLVSSRNFYGVLRVKLTHPEAPKFFAHDLFDGQILHGYQLQTPPLNRVATSYFSNTSGIGLALQNHPLRRQGRGLKVGIIGLGIGTIAAHGRAGDIFRFYEINPDVIRLAEGDGGYFSFLSDSQAKIQIVQGDARISLERELLKSGPQGFDVFAVDAFQSDSIPIHLISKEAIELYLKHLKEDGLLLIHVTNLNLSLEPILDRLASELDLVISVVRDEGDGWVSLRSHWVFLTRDPMILAQPPIAEKTSLPQQLKGKAPLWTDDHASILPIIR